MTVTEEEVVAAWQLVVSTAADAATAESDLADATTANTAASLAAGAARDALRVLVFPEAT